MKGLIKLNPDSLINLVNECNQVVCNFDKSMYAKKELRWSWREFKKVEFVVYTGMPFWSQYIGNLKDYFYKLYKIYEQASEFGDEIWLSELSYTHMCLLKDGSRDANPIYIIDY